MYTFNWALTAFRSESYIGSATALPDRKDEYVAPNLNIWLIAMRLEGMFDGSQFVARRETAVGTYCGLVLQISVY